MIYESYEGYEHDTHDREIIAKGVIDSLKALALIRAASLQLIRLGISGQGKGVYLA